MNYHLSLTEKQAHVLIKALDFYSRIKCGQLTEIENIFRDVLIFEERKIPLENLEKSEKVLADLKRLLFPEIDSPNASYGIREAPGESEKIAYDIQQVVRHRLAWDGVKPGEKPQGVWGYEPWKTSTTQDLPKIEKAT